METSIRRGKRIFLGDQVFSHGLSRSGFFNKRESIELEEYGMQFHALQQGTEQPMNEEEQIFVEQITNTLIAAGEPIPSKENAEIYAVKLWRKYLKAVAQAKSRHGFLQSESKVQSAANLTPPQVAEEIYSFQVELS